MGSVHRNGTASSFTRLSPPPEPPSIGRQDHGHKDLFTDSQEELSTLGPASPPYQSVPSSSNLHYAHGNNSYRTYSSVPSYRSVSHSNLSEPLMTAERGQHGSRREDTLTEDEKPKLSVHYKENIKPFQIAGQRQDSSGDYMSSRASSFSEDDSSDYDWSGEEDLVDEEAKFEKKMGLKTKPQGWGIKRIFGFLFSSLVGSVFLAGVLVTPPLIIRFYWYKPHPTDHRLYVKDNIEAWFFWAASNLVISWWLAALINVVPIVAWFIISAAWGHVSEFVKTRLEMYNSVKDNIKPVLYAASGWVSWTIIFGGIYKLFNSNDPTQSRAGYTRRLSQVVEFLFFFALILCASRMLSHAIAFNFHRTAYKERIETLEKSLTVIEKLRDYRPARTAGGYFRSGARTPLFKGSAISDTEHAARLNQALMDIDRPRPNRRGGDDEGDGDTSDLDNGATLVNRKQKKNRRSWFGRKEGGTPEEMTTSPRESLEHDDSIEGNELPHNHLAASSIPLTPSNLNPHRYPPQVPSRGGSPQPSNEGGVMHAAKAIKNAVLHDARGFVETEDEDLAQLNWDIGSSREAKRLARAIYMRFKDRKRTYLVPSDFYPAFPTEEAARDAFRVFDKDNNGDISRAEIKTTLLKVYKERRFLSRSMRDVGEVLKTLYYLILFFGGVILFFVSLSVFGVEVGSSLTSVYSIGIAASFIFKSSASSAFDAIMFLFVTHPYDTGDRCFIDNENLVVKKVGLFATVFARSDGTETYYFNSQLFSKFITNVRRSGKTTENLSMQVSWRTPLEKLDALERCLNEWLETEENRWFEPSTNITLQHVVYQRYLELTIGIGHNGNWQDWGLRNTRKTAFHAAVQYYCTELGITGHEAPLPIAYADPKTKTYNPVEKLLSPPNSPADLEGNRSPRERARTESEWQEIEGAARKIKPSLGFLPPLRNREKTLSRSRKSKSRKTVLRGVE